MRNNGGPTLTMGQLSGSPTLDAGIAGGLTDDQRGQPRPYDHPGVPNAGAGDGSDIGAVELIPPVLAIERIAANVRLLWSTNEIGYTLESTPAFANPAVWTTVPGTPGFLGNQYAITNGPIVTNRFYRLKK